jgi:hypothetical protein
VENDTARRERYIGAGKPGAFALLREWYRETGPCYVPDDFRCVSSPCSALVYAASQSENSLV